MCSIRNRNQSLYLALFIILQFRNRHINQSILKLVTSGASSFFSQWLLFVTPHSFILLIWLFFLNEYWCSISFHFVSGLPKHQLYMASWWLFECIGKWIKIYVRTSVSLSLYVNEAHLRLLRLRVCESFDCNVCLLTAMQWTLIQFLLFVSLTCLAHFYDEIKN